MTLRLRGLTGVALAGSVLVAACAQVAPATTTPAPVQSPVPPPAGSACTASELEVAAGPPSGGVGRRGAQVDVANRSSDACVLPERPAVAITDAGGTRLLEGTSTDRATGSTLLEPGARRSFLVEYTNWCDASVGLPLYFVLQLETEAIPITGLSAATRDDLPPCNGPGQPPTLSTTAWQTEG